jgi:uncharacterized protein YrrD
MRTRCPLPFRFYIREGRNWSRAHASGVERARDVPAQSQQVVRKENAMLYSARQLNGWTLAARDGSIGHAREVYFDDDRWVIRHVVADTGGWLSGRKVLISPHAVERLDADQGELKLSLTRRQVEDAPGIETDQPVSRLQETSYYDHYGYPYYWAGSGLWGGAEYPMTPDVFSARDRAATERMEAPREAADPHLRSSDEVRGYRIEATDGDIGHIEDFLFDERTWQIRCVVVDTQNWLPGRLVLLSPQSITDIDWNRQHVKVRVPREAVRQSPPYERHARLSEDELVHVQRHYEGWQ